MSEPDLHNSVSLTADLRANAPLFQCTRAAAYTARLNSVSVSSRMRVCLCVWVGVGISTVNLIKECPSVSFDIGLWKSA